MQLFKKKIEIKRRLSGNAPTSMRRQFSSFSFEVFFFFFPTYFPSILSVIFLAIALNFAKIKMKCVSTQQRHHTVKCLIGCHIHFIQAIYFLYAQWLNTHRLTNASSESDVILCIIHSTEEQCIQFSVCIISFLCVKLHIFTFLVLHNSCDTSTTKKKKKIEFYLQLMKNILMVELKKLKTNTLQNGIMSLKTQAV